MDLARCPMSRDEYFDLVRMHGHLPTLKCESCGVEDPHKRVMADETIVRGGKSLSFTICDDCKQKARRYDPETWRSLEAALKSR